jgi:hypothetical protein
MMYVLLYCYADGDSNIIDDAFVAMSNDKSKLCALALERSSKAEIFIDKPSPDDLRYCDDREAFRVLSVEPL